MLTETKLTARLVKSWREMNCEVINIAGSAMQDPGWPDVFVCGRLWDGFIEFKGPTTPLQPHQARIIQRLEEANTNVCIVRFIEQEDVKWEFNFEKHDGTILRIVRLVGTDGQVAAGLLKLLGRLP